MSRGVERHRGAGAEPGLAPPRRSSKERSGSKASGKPTRERDGPRVLHLTTEFPPVIYGGLGTAVGGWVKASARSGMDVGVLLVEGVLLVDEAAGAYGSGAGGLGPPGLRTVVDREGIRFFQSPWAEAEEVGVRLVEAWRPDVVHLHTAMLWPVARAIQEHTARPLVYHVHSVDRAEYEIGQEPNPWLAHSQAQEAAIALADRLIAISASEAELLARYYPDARRRVRVVGNGIADSPRARGAARRRQAGRSPLVLYSGRLVERKGIRELLAAIPMVLQSAPITRFVLAGGPPPLSGEEVKRQWVGPELSPHLDQVHFTGWLTPDQLARWYCAADVLAVPSRYEPFGMVVLEGMLYGLAVAASRVGGPAEILEHERTGLLFPPGEAEGLAQALSRLAEDADLRLSLARSAAREVRRRWAWPRSVQKMRKVYRELV